MKKTVAAALAAAFVVGSSVPAFAAANPFSDVPAGHWSYQAVAALADDGIIEGYGDGTYRGDRQITRYEMAQMIAKALARTDKLFDQEAGLSQSGHASIKRNYHAVKADLDRLSAEFRDELDALGVRVAELEKYADKVVWHGEMRYRYWNEKEDVKHGGDIKRTKNRIEMRFLPTATINDHWTLKARFDARINMAKDTGDSWNGDFHLRHAYAAGDYGKLKINVGRLPFFTNADDGLVMDDFFSGAQIVYGDKFKVALMAGRYSNDGNFDDPASYQGGEISYDTGKFYIGAGYHHFKSDDFRAIHNASSKSYKDSATADVWAVGARYNFDNGINIGGAYASNTKAKEFKRSWTAGIGYKGADKKHAGTWGIRADYHYVSDFVSLAPTFDTYSLSSHKKGVDIGVDWTPIDNTYVALNYFWGKTLDTHQDTRTFFGRASWFF